MTLLFITTLRTSFSTPTRFSAAAPFIIIIIILFIFHFLFLGFGGPSTQFTFLISNIQMSLRRVERVLPRGQTVLLGQRHPGYGEGEAVELLQVLVLQGNVPVLHLDGQLPLAQFVRFGQEVVDLVLCGSKVVILAVVVEVVGIDGMLSVLSKEVVHLLSALVIKAAKSAVAKVPHWIIVALVRGIGNEIQGTFDSTTSEAEVASGNIRRISIESVRN